MNDAVSSSLYDSASSRAHAPQAGAALKSTSNGLFDVFASASAASASFSQCTFMGFPLRQDNPDLKLIRVFIRVNLWLKRDGLFGPELEFAVLVDFGFSLDAVRDLDDVIEHALAHLIDGFGAVDNSTRIEIEIV